MNWFKNSLTILVLLSFTGCAEQMHKMQSDIRRIDGGLSDLRAFQAEQTTKIADLESQLRAVSGRIDEIDHSQRQKLGNLDTIQSDLSTLRKRVPPPAVVPVKQLEEDEAAVAQLPNELQASANRGLQDLRDGAFDRSRADWQEFLDLSVGTEWAAMGLFWEGVSQEGLGEDKKALEAYHEFVARYPKSPRAAQALLRQGALLVASHDLKLAKIVYSKLAADYPRSTEAQRARERLKDLR